MSDDDAILRAAGAHLRERSASEPSMRRRLDALARGDLTTEEIEALEAEAADDEALALAVAAHRPLDEAFHASLAQQVAAQLRASPPGNARAEAPSTPSDEPESTAPASTWRWARVALPLAAAAAVALFFAFDAPEPAPLPSYEMVARADATHRSTDSPDEAPAAKLSIGSRLEVTLRPEQDVSPPIAAMARWSVDGELTENALPVTVAPSGSALIRGSREQLFGDRVGMVVVRVAIGRPDLLDDALTSPAAAGVGWQRFDVKVELLPP